MPVVSLYRANRLWHKGEIAEKGRRKAETRWCKPNPGRFLRGTANNPFIKHDKEKALQYRFLFKPFKSLKRQQAEIIFSQY